MTEAQDVAAELVFECELDAPPGKVWRALAVPELREAWLGEPDGGPARVLEAEPGSRLVLDWPTGGRDSQVTFEIEPGEDGGAHLRIVHAPRATVAIVPFRSRASGRTVMTACGAGFRKAA
jgi:uncharacterized protein YndB with AHSA1/START domain